MGRSYKEKLCMGLETCASLLRDKLFFHLKDKNFSDIQSFLQDEDVFHSLYRLHPNPSQTCQCGRLIALRGKKSLFPNQWNLLYKGSTCASDIHGFRPNPDLKLEKLDISLLVTIFLKCVIFRFEYLEKVAREQRYVSVEDLIQTSQHYLWSAWRPTEKCKCGTILHGSPKTRRLTQNQWDALFDCDASVPCNYSVKNPINSSDIDIETIEIILRKNPQKCDELVYIEEIQAIRNKVYHSGDDWKEKDFEAQWTELKAATLAIAGRTLTNSELFYTRRFEEIETLDNLSTFLILQRLDSVPEKVRAKMENSQREIEANINSNFVPTNVYKSALNIVKQERVVLLKGKAGEGKSYTAYQIAWACLRDSREEIIPNVLIVRNAIEWSEYVSSWNCENTIIVLDDFLGKYADDEKQATLAPWLSLIPTIRSTLTETKRNSCILVISEYTYRVFKIAIENTIMRAFPVACKIKDMFLSTTERLQILKSYNNTLNQDLSEKIVDKVEQLDVFGFPQCCIMYSNKSLKDENTFLSTIENFLQEEVSQLPKKVKVIIDTLKKCYGRTTEGYLASALKDSYIKLDLCNNIFILRTRTSQGTNFVELIPVLVVSLPPLPRSHKLWYKWIELRAWIINQIERGFAIFLGNQSLPVQDVTRMLQG
ncbi:uncharacterized protein LOC134257715 [Saccostrea cucullata]|uniref:uncharacterized protein LOC134257715 n=1 Tax=Saccostrea cuccullata TaxID=36930 RepID=UPI002ED00A5B